MQAPAEITPWYWVIFTAFIIVFLALDLGLFHRQARAVRFKEALGWTFLWFTLAILFAGGLWWHQGKQAALEFFTGYFIELSLSMDNVLVIALIFSYFKVPPQFQHRVLFWGVLAALVMRGLMILLGMELILQFDWIFYVFGFFLVLTGIKMLLTRDAAVDPEQSFMARMTRKFLPISPDFDGQKFVTRINGKWFLTPLFVVLLLVETTDLIFAFDSIPAIFGVTRQPFIAFTSNVFAILGLRSLYFVLAGAVEFFRHLKIGLAVVLVFIGVKMFINPHNDSPEMWQREIPINIALGVVVAIIAISMLTSVIAARREKRIKSARDKSGSSR